MVRRILLAGTATVLAVAALAVAYVGLVAVRHARSVTLPVPTGRYDVGRVRVDWVDRDRPDPFAPRATRRRELSVWLWYPSARTAGPRARAPYAPGAWAGLHLPSLLGLGETGFDAVHTHAVEGAAIAPGRFPVVVLEPGLGLAAPQYTTLAEDLASHGYVVAGVTPTYSANLTVLRGRPVPASEAGKPRALEEANSDPGRADRAGAHLVAVWAADARFVAGRLLRTHATPPDGLASHVDPARTAYVGHSLGGAAALEACRTDRRCAAAADLDGTPFGRVVRQGLRRPFLILGSEGSCVVGHCRPAGPADRAGRANARTLIGASAGPAWCHRIAGTGHFNFTDYGAYYLAAPVRYLLGLGPIDGRRALHIADAYVVALLDRVVGADAGLTPGGHARPPLGVRPCAARPGS